MVDIILEIIRVLIVAFIFYLLYSTGRDKDIRQQQGWLYIVVGFGLILFGTAVDITDNFPSLNKYIILGDTVYQAFLEKVICFLGGFSLIAIGFWKWIPVVITLRKTEKSLKKAHDFLELKVNERTAQLEEEIQERKQTDEQLRKSRDQYQSLVSNIPGITYRCKLDKDWTMMYMSTAVDSISGYPASDFINNAVRTYSSVIYSEDSEYVEQSVNKAVELSAAWEIEYRIRHKDGSIHWAFEKGRGVPGEDGTLKYLDGFILDITKRKKLEEKLTSNEENFRTFFNSIDHFLFVLDEQGNMIKVNETVIQRLEYSEDDLIGRNVLMVHPEDRQVEAGRIVGEMIAGTAVFCPVPLVTKSGQHIQVETRVYPGSWNDKPALFGVSKDITRIKETEELFSKAFQAGSSLMAISEIESGLFINVNKTFLDTLGYTRDEVIGKSSIELGLFYNPEDRYRVLSMVKEPGFVENIEVKIRVKEGEPRIGLFSVSQIDVGHKPCWMITMTDITELKQTEKALHHQTEIQTVLMEISSKYINISLDMVDDAIQTALIDMGRHFSADRVYVFDYDFKNNTTSNTYEWCNTDIIPQIDELQGVPLEGLTDWVRAHLNGHVMLVPDVTALPEGSLKDILEPQNIQTLITVPMIHGKELLGFVGFDWVVEHYSYSDDEIKLLSLFAEILVNITLRKQAGIVVQESKQRLDMALTGTNAGLWDWFIQTGQIVINERWAEIAGYTLKELDPTSIQTWIDLCHPDDLTESNNLVQSHCEGKTDYYEYEARMRHKNGDWVWIADRGKVLDWDSDGKPVRMAGTHLDITERKKAEAKILNAKNKTEAILKSSTNGIITINQKGIIETFNPAAMKIFGYSYEEIIGQNVNLLMPEEHAQKHDQYLKNYLKTGIKNIIDKRIETIAKRKNGELFPIDIGISEVKLKNNKLFTAIVADITEKKKTERDLEKAKKEAEAATKAKGDFLANMSHEIRTPMNAILGLNYLQLKTDLTHKQNEYARKIGYSAKHLLGIINDILDFSKIEAGKLDIEEIGFSLNNVLDNLSSMIRVKAKEKEIELIILKDPKIPSYLLGDPLRLGQILINLSTNAIKFTNKGEVVVCVEKVNMNKNSVTLKFSVRDTGIGLSEDHKNKLFQSFQQSDTSTTRKYGGTGLGLSISKKLVELMHGNIGVDSVEGKGSTFYFTASFKVSEISREERTEVIPEIIQNLNVLIVDDSKTFLAMMNHYCKSLTFNVQTAENGEDALKILRNNCFISVVIMDWKMPERDGLSVLREIKSDLSINPKPKLILMTAYDEGKVFTQVEEFGLDGFLNKPVTQSMILNTVAHSFGITISSPISTRKKMDTIEPLKSIRGASLLLVEDNEINQQIAVELLESEGLIVEVADNGKIAVDMINSNPGKYNLVLMDLQMPIMDGYTATRNIRENKSFDSLPIIAMTADAMSGVEDKVLKIGMNDYITKPIDVDELYKTLIKWIKPEEMKGKPKQEKQVKVEQDAPAEIVLPGIDMKNGLKRVAGNKKLYLKILRQFAENNRKFTGNVLKAVENKDQKLAVRIAHTLKGVAGNISAEMLFQTVKKLEKLLHEGLIDTGEIKMQLDNVNKLLIPLIEKIDTFQSEQQKDIVKSEVKERNFNAVKDAIAVLKDNLEQYDAAASESYDNLKEELAGSDYVIELLDLEKYINTYDFENALEILEKLSNKIF